MEAVSAVAAYRLQKFAAEAKGQSLPLSLIFVALVAGIIGTTIGLLKRDASRPGR